MSYLIIGAGPCGLAAAKGLKDASISYEHVEADSNLGGNWLHGVYSSVYTDACKDVMQYPEFPMPKQYPDFLSRKQMLVYLNNYADHFDLRKSIKFNTKVIWIAAIENNQWKVIFEDEPFKIYSGVIICNGHHWDMKFADLHGNFTGEYIHSKEYKDPSQLRNKRVLIVGAGNSAADISCEAARVSACSVLSMNDSPWIFPKSFMGIPLGRMKLKNAPSFLQPLFVKLLIKFSFGNHALYNLPKPRHKPFEKHPTVSEELPNYLKHGRIKVKPGITRTENNRVWFKDDTHLDFDLVVSATGFHLSFPFLPDLLVRKQGQNLRCFGYCVYPDYKGLFFLGWQQVRGGIGSLASAFSKVIVDLIKLEESTSLPSGFILQSMGNKMSKTHLYGSKDIYNWISKHTYSRLIKKAKRNKGVLHLNKPTPGPYVERAYEIRVY
ncbi:MAG: flavin-containing monooxygenase [Chitinophagales bacterium]